MTEEEVLALQNELESTGRALEGIKAEKETLAADLQSRAAVITDLQQVVAARDSDIATLKQAMVEGDEAHTALNGSLASLQETLGVAVSAYKAALALANPAVPVDLITGDTIESVDRSLESAKSLVSTVRASIEAELAAGKVPAGAPARSAPDLDSLSPREKIQYAVTKGGKS